MFVTFRLYGTLPVGRVFPNARLSSGQAFVAMDRLLDHPKAGPPFLRQREIAEMFIHGLHQGERRFERYELHSFAVMPNHVHLLVTPRVASKDWLGPLKGFTAHEAIRTLGLHRKPFWQDESYDHLIRGDEECWRVKRYIEWNPVKAGLAATPGDFPFSSATPGRSPAAGRKA